MVIKTKDNKKLKAADRVVKIASAVMCALLSYFLTLYVFKDMKMWEWFPWWKYLMLSGVGVIFILLAGIYNDIVAMIAFIIVFLSLLVSVPRYSFCAILFVVDIFMVRPAYSRGSFRSVKKSILSGIMMFIFMFVAGYIVLEVLLDDFSGGWYVIFDPGIFLDCVIFAAPQAFLGSFVLYLYTRFIPENIQDISHRFDSRVNYRRLFNEMKDEECVKFGLPHRSLRNKLGKLSLTITGLIAVSVCTLGLSATVYTTIMFPSLLDVFKAGDDDVSVALILERDGTMSKAGWILTYLIS